MSTKLTVLLPVYNGEKYIEQTIRSVLAQTYKDFIFLIINDGSNDKTLEILNKYESMDKRIKVVSRENKGLVYTLNEGLKRCETEYIARIDADDICEKDRFAKQLQYMDQNPKCVLCGTNTNIFFSNIPFIRYRTRLPIQNDEIKVRHLFQTAIMHPTVLIKTQILKEHNINYKEEFYGAEDYEMWNRVFEYGEVFNLKKALLRYRLSDINVTKKMSVDIKKREECIRKILKENLNRFQFRFTHEELDIHTDISLSRVFRFNKFSIQQKKEWLENLLIQNEENGKLKKDVFEREICEQYIYNCLKYGRYQDYRDSQFYQIVKIGRIQFEVKRLKNKIMEIIKKFR